jgi:hypothetical protein
MNQYQIRVQGHLDARWLRRFASLEISQQPEGDTLVSGALDQAALHGLLQCFRDLGLELISIQRIERTQS